MLPKTKVYAVSVAAFLAFIFALIPVAAGAGSITLTPTAQAPSGSLRIVGTGFGATKAVGLGFGAEANVTGEAVSAIGPYDVDLGPYFYNVSYWPVKPGSFKMESYVLVGGNPFSIFEYWDNGNGTISTTNSGVASATIDYVTGKVVYYFTTPLSSAYNYVRTVNYTRYQYNMTPVGGVTTNSSGAFTTLAYVPAVANGNYVVTAMDTQGNIATATVNVNSTIPEFPSFGVILLLSSAAVVASSRHFRKRPRTTK